MYHHVKKLMYTVRVDEPDPRFGNMLLDLALIGAAQRAEHYEIAAYTTARNLELQLRQPVVVQFLTASLGAKRRTAARSGGSAFDVGGRPAWNSGRPRWPPVQRVRERAYQIWLEEHCPEGRDKVHHWEMATAHIASENGGPPSTRVEE